MPSRPAPWIAAVAGVALLVVTRPGPAAPPTDADMLAPFPHPKGYVCHRLTEPAAVDGALGDKGWAAVPWSEAFVDIEGDRRPAPRHRTRVKMAWDDQALYVAAELQEPHVWGTLTEHDAVIFHDNDFELFLDPDGDNHAYGELELNALNTTWDLLLTKPYKDGGKAVNAWEVTGLKTAVKVDGTLNDPRDTDTGWTVEVRWPWAGLRELAGGVPPKDGDRWRINFSRVEWDVTVEGGKYKKVPNRPEHNWVWSPQGVIDMHRPERWGYLQFSTAAAGTVAFRPDPDWEARDLLHRVYYAQRAYRVKTGRFATTPADLGLTLPPGRVTLGATRTGFEAAWLDPAGRPKLTVTHDGQCRRE
jgi:hypothetical protein